MEINARVVDDFKFINGVTRIFYISLVSIKIIGLLILARVSVTCNKFH